MRIVEGVDGRVPMRMELVIRFDYGSIVPWVRRVDDGHRWPSPGPTRCLLDAPVELRGEDLHTVAEFERRRRRARAVRAHLAPVARATPPQRVDAEQALDDTDACWRDWAGRCTYTGRATRRSAARSSR